MWVARLCSSSWTISSCSELQAQSSPGFLQRERTLIQPVSQLQTRPGLQHTAYSIQHTPAHLCTASALHHSRQDKTQQQCFAPVTTWFVALLEYHSRFCIFHKANLDCELTITTQINLLNFINSTSVSPDVSMDFLVSLTKSGDSTTPKRGLIDFLLTRDVDIFLQLCVQRFVFLVTLLQNFCKVSLKRRWCQWTNKTKIVKEFRFAVILTCDGSSIQDIWRTRLWLSIKIYNSLLYASSQEWNCLCVKTGNLCLGSLTFGISMKLQNWQILNLNFAIPAKPQYCIRVWNVRPS